MFARYGIKTSDGIAARPFSQDEAARSTVPTTDQIPVASLNQFGTYNPGIITSLGGSLPAPVFGPVHGELFLGRQDEGDYSDAVTTSVVENWRLEDVGQHNDDLTPKRAFPVGQIFITIGRTGIPGGDNEKDTVRHRAKRYKKRPQFTAFPAIINEVATGENVKGHDSRCAWVLATQIMMYPQKDSNTAHFSVAVKNVAEVRTYPFTGVESLLEKLGYPGLWRILSRIKPYGAPANGDAFSTFEPGIAGDTLSVIPILELTGAVHSVRYVPVLDVTRADRAAIIRFMNRNRVNNDHGRDLMRCLNKIFRMGRLHTTFNKTDDHWVVAVNPHAYTGTR